MRLLKPYFIGAILILALVTPAAAQQGQGGSGDGFIRQWLVCGTWPIAETERNLLPDDQLPYEGLVTMGRLWVVSTANEAGFVDLAGLGGGSYQATLTHVYLHSEERQSVKLLLGSDDRAHLAVNGTWLHRSERSGAWQPDQETVDVVLDEGWNQVMLRVENDVALYGFSVRVTLPDGRPLSLRSSAQVPEALMMRPSMRRPLSEEGLTELLELMTQRTGQTILTLDRAIQGWRREGPALDQSYEDARARAINYVTALRAVLETMPRPDAHETEQTDLPQAWQLARRHLRDAAAEGPGPLLEASASLLDHARVGARLWEMGRFAASAPLEVGHYAGEVDRTLSDATALLATIHRRYLRPYRLQEQTLQHRTAAMTIRLLDAAENPLEGVPYRIEQVRHEFLFGCNLFAFGAFERPEDNQRYLDRFEELFNHAIVPIYWPLIEPRQDELRFGRDERGLPGPDEMMAWCSERGIAVRAAPLLSQQAQPAWLKERSADDVREAVRNHLWRMTARYGSKAAFFDLSMSNWRSLTLGRLQLDLPYVLEWSNRNAPKAGLHLRSGNVHILTRGSLLARERELRLDGLTLTLDQSRNPLPIEEFDMQLSRLAATNLPVHICQVALGGSRRQELAQAEAAEAIYRTAFANPAVQAISWWDLSDRFARGRQPVGLLDADLKPKEAWHRLSRLIKEQWWTKVSGHSEGDGRVDFRGYFGTYEITVTVTDTDGRPRQVSRTVSLGRDDPREVVIVVPR